MTAEAGSTVKIGIQGAVLAPTSGDAAGAFDTDFDAAERSRRPYLESRIRLRWGDDPSDMSELGCAAHLGWVTVAAAPGARPDSMLTSKAVGCDARMSLTDWLDVRGEVYTGQLMRGLGGGAIAQGVGNLGRPIQNKAGWLQLNLTPITEGQSGAGCGIDDPRDSDVIQDRTGRLQNTACALYTSFGREVRFSSGRKFGGSIRDTSARHSRIII
jgi:hypothetical protein